MTSTNNNPGPTIAIMRPERYEQDSVQICRQAGFEVISAPMIEILGKKDEHFDGFVSRVLTGKSDIVIFTSANGIDHTLDKVPDQEVFINALNRLTTVAIGPKTREAAEEQGIDISFMPESYSSKGLVEAIRHKVKGKVVDIARSSHGALLLVDGLKAAGAEVFETKVYGIAMPARNSAQEELVQAIMDQTVDVVVFTSSMMVRNFLDLASQMGVREKVIQVLNGEGMVVAAIGHPTANTLNMYEIQVTIVSSEYTFKALIHEIKKEFGIDHD
ncbi:MAG: uroporphyrinogen-III synthase [Methanosarcinales archaeon]|nr:uroporphyrinogen-III synthase [Methanosarcinales archaeon]MCD4765041.1 uroporphyrinogen-III synthase [Methanosarcinales archaeon]